MSPTVGSIVVIVLLNILLAPLASPNGLQEPMDCWEFEPKVWTHTDEASAELVSDAYVGFDEFGPMSDQLPSLGSSGFVEQQDAQREEDEAQQVDPHVSSYFLASQNYRDNLEANQTEQPAKECNQFRADIRDAVICDRMRCDKLDFEWPSYDNQLTLVQTTKHGMRFHRVDLAFAKPNPNPRLASEATQESRIKLDLLEHIFKPKPSSSSTTTTTTTTTATTATTDTTTKTTESPQTSSTSDSTPANTTKVPDESRTTEKATEQDDDESDLDRNRLMATLRLDTRRLKQQMVGFGGALSDSSCRNIKSLSSEMGTSLMEDYFGSRGLRYSLARLSVGSSDFSTTPYTNNDLNEQSRASARFKNSITSRSKLKQQQEQQQHNEEAAPTSRVLDDVDMKNFRLTSEDLDFKLPIVRQAIATNKEQQLKLIGSLWSPPIWMKNNTHIVHGYLKGDVYGPYYRALAELMLKWLEAYRRNGIEMWAFTGLNEPATGIKPFIFHNSLGITKDDYLTFIKLHLGPMMRQRGFGQVKLMLLDDNKGYAPNYVKSAMKDAQVARYISGIAIHWYMNDEYENLEFIARDYPDKFVLSTEASNGYLPFQTHVLPGNWDRGVAYMLDMIKVIQKNSVGWLDWNMALDLKGGPSWAQNYLDAPIIVNAKRNEYYKSPTFYAIGHMSRFVQPQSMRLEQILANARFDYPFETVAFLTPNNYVVIVALNANKAPIPFKIITNRRLIRVVTLKAQSFNTIVFKAPKK